MWWRLCRCVNKWAIAHVCLCDVLHVRNAVISVNWIWEESRSEGVGRRDWREKGRAERVTE